MSLPIETPFASFTANGVTDTFSYSFTVLEAGDLVVTGTIGGTTTTYVYGGEYTLTGLGSASGSVVFTAAPANGTTIKVRRETSLERSTDYQENGDLLAATVNADFDRIWMAMQEVSGVDQPRAIRVPLGETVPDLPAAASRANMVLGFDSDGDPTVISPTSGSAADVLILLANSTDSSKGAGAVGLGATTAYADGSLGNLAQTMRALRSGRTVPHANFSWFSADWTVAQCQGPGRARLDQDLADLFHTKFSGLMGGAVSFVKPTGNDVNDGATWASAFLTLTKALRNTSNGTIYLWPGTYDLADFRYTDSYGDKPKKIIAPFGGVTLKVSGDTISAATWTANGTYGAVYQTTLSTSNKPIRILHTGLVDRFGEPVPIPQQASLVDVNASTFGWYYDSGTKILYVRVDGENVNTTTKANLVAVYGDTSLSNRTLIYSATSYWEGITFWGYVSVLKLAGQAVPQFWAKNCTFKYGASAALLVEGGYCYTQGCRAHRCAGDGANYNTTAGTVSQGLEIDYRTEFCGDVGTYGTTQALNPLSTAENKNGSSNHDSYVVRVNGQHDEAWGPAIADTAGSFSWCLGTVASHSALTPGTAPAVPRYGILNQANAAWLDGCAANGHDGGFEADTSANVRTFNCFGSKVTATSGVFTPYIPS